MSDDRRDGDEPSTDEVEPTGDDAAEETAADAPVAKRSGPPPRPTKAEKAAKKNPPPRPKNKDRATPARGGGKRARRRRARRPASLVLAIVALVGLVALTAVLGTRAADGGEATFWIYAGAVVAAVVGISLVTWFLDAWNLRHRGIGSLVFIVTLAVISLTAVTTTDTSPQLGLDLQGGFSVVLSAQGDPPSDNIDQAMEIIRNRIDALGVAEPEVTRQGDNVVVDLPGIEDRARAQEILGETAKLEFRPVLQQGLPYDAAAAEAGDDPCAAGLQAAEAAADPTATDPAADPATTDPATGSTVPGDTTATEPGASTEPSASTEPTASTEAPATTGEQEGAGATPAPSTGAVADGEQAAPLPRQETTTTTTAPADPSSTTAPADPTATTAPAEGPTPTTTPAEPEASAGGSIAVPFRPDAEQEPSTCALLGPESVSGDSLSKSQAELGGQTGSQWIVNVAIKSGQRAAANALMNGCNQAAPTCPTQQMGIVLDGELISAPTVNDPNLADDDFVISGGGTSGFAEGEAKDLALKLRYGALPVEFTRSAERQVSPTLGEDSLRAGILAGLIGLVAVAVYLLIYYRALGLVVVLGLAVWSALMYGVVCWFSASRGLTLSLSGVVGIVISLGTTVDSYVVYFERLKDEVRMGKTVRSATERSFQKAFRTILTADVASLMGAVLLWWLTVGAVRGFAFFLGLSVVLDVLVAYCFARPVVALLARNRFFTENNVFGVARGLGRHTDDDDRPATRAPAKAGAAS